MGTHVLERPISDTQARALWVRSPGIDLLGEYEGGGWTEPHYLARRGDGQFANLTGLLYHLLEEAEAPASAHELHERLSDRLGDLGEDAEVENIEAMLRDLLAPAGMVILADDAPPSAAAPTPDPLIALGLRGTLVPARTVRAVARPLAALFHTPIVVVVLAALVAADFWMFSRASVVGGLDAIISGPLLVIPLAVASILLTFLHEFGHASACAYGGGRPGRVGFGVMIIWPVFFTDVTDAYRLRRSARIRTDLGGLYFDAIGILAVIGAYALTGYDVLALFVVILHLSALEELIPAIRGDGYYLLGDLSGVPEPFSVVGPTMRSLVRRTDDPALAVLRPSARRVLRTWALLVVPFMTVSIAFMLWALPVSVPRWLASVQFYGAGLVAAVGAGTWLSAVYLAASLVTLMVPVAGVAVLVVRLARAARRALSRRATTRPPRHVPRHRR